MRTITRIAATAVATAVAGFTLAAIAAAPASATSVVKPPTYCTTYDHADTKPFVNLAANGTTVTTGTHTLVHNGVKLVTPDAAAKVYGYLPLDPAIKLTDIHAAGFDNTNTAGLPPSYQFGLSVGGAWGGTLAWESTYQPAGLTGTKDVLHGGASKWYVTKDHPGLPKHTPKTWAEILMLLPTATATYYGLNVGAGGPPSTNVVDELKLSAGKTCTFHIWSTNYIVPTVKVAHTCTGSTVTVSTTGNDALIKIGTAVKLVKAGAPAVFTVAASPNNVMVYRRVELQHSSFWKALDQFTWKKPAGCVPATTAPATTAPATTPPATATASASTVPPVQGAGSLPVTGPGGNRPLVLAAAGTVLVAGGVVVLILLRRRRVEETYTAVEG